MRHENSHERNIKKRQKTGCKMMQDRFSNINWEAFAYGALEDRYWANIAAFACMFIAAFIVGSVHLTIFVVLCSYVLLAPRTVYLALHGNRMLLEDIQELELDSEEEQEARVMAAARQRKFTLREVLIGRLVYYFVGSICIARAFMREGLAVDYVLLFQVILLVIVLDALTLAAILLFAFLRGDTESELYSGDISNEIVDSISIRGPIRR